MQKSPPSKIRLPLDEISRQLDVPLSAVYGALLFIVAMAGVIVTSQALTRTQNLVGQADTYQTVDCNQPCTNNRYCKPNHFCYQGKCRLASNPENLSCQPKSTTQEPEEQKGAEVVTQVPSAEISDSDTDETATLPATIQQPSDDIDSTEAGELLEDQIMDQEFISPQQEFSLLDFLMGEDNSRLFVVLGIGAIGLLVIVAVVTILSSSSKKTNKLKPVETPDFSNLEKK